VRWPWRTTPRRHGLVSAYLAAAVLAGLLANNVFGVWWLDPAVALGIAALAIREGRRSWRGEAAECATCTPLGLAL
jgi:divalent metal cation (Fe/Co/Zn/Cd) transporter